MAQRQWRISLDGATICCGTAVSAAPEGAGVPPVRIIAAAWSAAPATLRDPAEVLCSELLALVFSFLSVRERLAASAVSRAWHRELSPAAAPRNACAWARLDLSGHAFPLPDNTSLSDALSLHILPRYGPHVRALSLRDTDAEDDDVRLVLERCPRLRELDLRGCESALGHNCAAWPVLSPLLPLLVDAYARAAPGTRLSLRLHGSGFAGCDECGLFCAPARRVAANALLVALDWPVKPPPGAPPPPEPVAWLRCDLEPCPRRSHDRDIQDYDDDVERPSNDCRTLMPCLDFPEWTRELDDTELPRICGECREAVCQDCLYHDDCPANPHSLCAACLDYLELDCDNCADDHFRCTKCCTTQCLAPGCGAMFCDPCLAESDAPITRCSDCGATACLRHSDGCDRCDVFPWRDWFLPHERSWTTLDKGDFRAMMRCCACQRTYCHDCDPGPDGQAGARPCGEDDGCIFCASWPEACTGLADAEEAWREASEIEEERARAAGEEDGAQDAR